MIVVTGDKGLCGSFNTNVIKGAAGYIAGSAEACSLGLVGRKGRDFFGRRGFAVLFEQVGIFQKLRFDDAQAIARTAIDAFIAEQVDRVVLVYNEFKSVMTQRVVVDSCCRFARGGRRGAGRLALAESGRLPVRTVAGGNLQPAAAALHRGADLPGAARVERGVLRRADDGDGHGDRKTPPT